MSDRWDYTTRLTPDSPPVLLSGEMVYSWMGDDYAWLRPLKPAAELLAAKSDWGPLYDRAQLGGAATPPVAALVSYEDIYVDRRFSETTAAMLGGKARCWITNVRAAPEHRRRDGSLSGGRRCTYPTKRKRAIAQPQARAQHHS